MEVLRRYEEIFTKIPGKASVIEHKNELILRFVIQFLSMVLSAK